MTKKNMEFSIRCMFLGGALVLLVALEGATGTTHNVGDSFGWAVPNDNVSYYTNWAANQTFMVGDKLVFNWTGTHTVAEVSSSDYNNCTEVNLVNGNPPVIISLNESGAKYYICTVGPHCVLGQKLYVNVSGYELPKGNNESSYGSSMTPALSFPALLSTGFILSLSFPVLPFFY